MQTKNGTAIIGKRTYMKVSDDQRAQLIDLMNQNQTISEAA